MHAHSSKNKMRLMALPVCMVQTASAPNETNPRKKKNVCGITSAYSTFINKKNY